MYRVNKSHDESSSDDEGPSLPKEQRLGDADCLTKDCKAGSKAAQMWTDLLAEQSLSETFSDKVGVYRGENDMVKRGVESYILPDLRCTSDDQKMRYQTNREISPNANDNEPFDFIADEEKIEKFSDKYEKCPRAYGGEHGRQRPISFIGQERNSRESWNHCASTSRSTSRGNGKRRRNNYDPNRRNGNRITKNIGALKHQRGERNPSLLSSTDYSLETLLTTEFPENISISELAERIVRALGERNEDFLRSVIIEIGEEKALELFEATRGIEASGGMLIADGTRRRTPGGVFMTLFKTDPDILPLLKKKVCSLQKTATREIRIAKRRGKRGAAKAFDITPEKVEMLKKLSTASEVLLEKQEVEEIMNGI
uniref:Phosphorylated adapter RNA export protein n=1 Tax=Wuchereria bancrofti TaxID=6293 RepID=A0AAF5PRF6_WUCBA